MQVPANLQNAFLVLRGQGEVSSPVENTKQKGKKQVLFYFSNCLATTMRWISLVPS